MALPQISDTDEQKYRLLLYKQSKQRIVLRVLVPSYTQSNQSPLANRVHDFNAVIIQHAAQLVCCARLSEKLPQRF